MKKLQAGPLAILLIVLFWNCGSKKKVETYFPVNSIIKAQVNNIDTSLFTIIKVTYLDSVRNDTTYIKREDFNELAKDFLSLPELTSKKYTKETVPGPLDGIATLTYKAIHPEKEELKQVDLIIDPAIEEKGKSQITTIIIEKLFANRDSSVEKKLLWQMDKSFQVTTIRQLPGQPEMYSSYKVIWNGVSDE